MFFSQNANFSITSDESKYIDKVQITDEDIKQYPMLKIIESWIPNLGLNIITGLNGSGKSKLLKLLSTKYPGKKIKFCPTGYTALYTDKKNNSEFIDLNLEVDLRKFGGDFFKTRHNQSLLQSLFKNVTKFNQFRDKKDYETALKEWKENGNNVYWVEIEEIMKDFGLNIRFDLNNLNHEILFRKGDLQEFFSAKDSRNPTETSISSGEEVAFSLAVMKYGNDFKMKNDILLIDEFDAHLNPSLIRKYMAIIRKHFVNKGVQVIMTTHNPIIVDLVNNDEVWWMQDGMIYSEISKRRPKASIFNQLADGLFSMNNLQEIFQVFKKEKDKLELVILCEGIHDEITLSKLICEDVDKIAIINCKNADNIECFVNLPYVESNGKKPTILCLFDNDIDKKSGKDGQGVQCKNKIDNMIKDNKIKFGNTVKTKFVSDIKGDRMEEVLKDNTKKNKLIEDIKKMI